MRTYLFIAVSLAVLMLSTSGAQIYPVEIVITTTSDWMDVRFIGATLVATGDYTVVRGGDVEGLEVHTLSRLSVIKSLSDGDATEVEVRFSAYISNLHGALVVQVEKGYLGACTVTLRTPDGATTIAGPFVHEGVADPDHNLRWFEFQSALIATAVDPVGVAAPCEGDLSRRRVLAFYYPWYGTSDGPSGQWIHWYTGTWADPHFHSAHMPVGGPYDSKDPETIKRHIQEAQAAGIDGFIVSWWGKGDFTDQVLDSLIEEAKKEDDFSITIYYEIDPESGTVASEIGDVLDRHGSEDCFLKVDGRPVIFFYGRVLDQHDLPEWSAILETLSEDGWDIFSVADGLDGQYLTTFDGIHTYNPVPWETEHIVESYDAASILARVLGKLFAATVVPGYDEAYWVEDGLYVDREEGDLYQDFWLFARDSQPHWILVTSFNEWHEGTEIEPSDQFEAGYLDITAEQAEAWRGDDPCPDVASLRFEIEYDTGEISPLAGTKITYGYVVENTGDAAFTSVVVSGEVSPSGGAYSFDLAPDPANGNRWIGGSAHTVSQGDVEAGAVINAAKATAGLDVGGVIEALAERIIPLQRYAGIKMVLTPDPSDEVAVGESISYEFAITNTGTVGLHDVHVTVSKGDVTGTVADLGPKETDRESFKCSYTVKAGDRAAGKVSQAATVTGTWLSEEAVRDAATVAVPVRESENGFGGFDFGEIDWSGFSERWEVEIYDPATSLEDALRKSKAAKELGELFSQGQIWRCFCSSPDWETFMMRLLGRALVSAAGGSVVTIGGAPVGAVTTWYALDPWPTSEGTAPVCARGEAICLRFSLLDLVSDAEVRDDTANYCVVRLDEDGTPAIVRWGLIPFSEGRRLYDVCLTTDNLEIGTYDLYIGTSQDRFSRRIRIEITEP